MATLGRRRRQRHARLPVPACAGRSRMVAALRRRRRRGLDRRRRASLSPRAHAPVAAHASASRRDRPHGRCDRAARPLRRRRTRRRSPPRRGDRRRPRRHAAHRRRQSRLRRAGRRRRSPPRCARVPFSAHLGLYRDETARLATWHLPALARLRELGRRARPRRHASTLMQPAILPLYDTRSPLEWLAALAAGDRRDGHDLVRSVCRGSAVGERRRERHRPQAQPQPPHRRRPSSMRRSGAGAKPCAPASSRAAPPGRSACRIRRRSLTSALGVDSAKAAASPAMLEAVFIADPSVDAGALRQQRLAAGAAAAAHEDHLGQRVHARARRPRRALGVATGDVVRVAAARSLRSKGPCGCSTGTPKAP